MAADNCGPFLFEVSPLIELLLCVIQNRSMCWALYVRSGRAFTS